MGDSEVVACWLQAIVSTDLLIHASQLGVATASVAISGTETRLCIVMELNSAEWVTAPGV